MALNEQELFIPGGGSVLIADVGATVPTDTTTPWDNDWTDLGYTTEDGVSFTPGITLTEVNAWQSRLPVRRTQTAESLDIAFSLLQRNEETLSLALRGGSWVGGVYTPPSAGVLNEYALGVEGVDGDQIERWVFARVIVSTVGAITLQRTNPSAIPITMSVLATADENPFTVIRTAGS